MLTVLLGFITSRVVEKRLGKYDPSLAPNADASDIQKADDAPEISEELDARGLKLAGWWFLGALAVVLAVTLPPGAPLRDPATGDIIGNSPFTSSLIVIISLLFLAARYDKRSGIGTVIALMLPYFAGLAVVWTIFYFIWYALGLPWGI